MWTVLSDGWTCTSIVEFLPALCKALDSIPSGKKKNQNKNKIKHTHKKPPKGYFFFLKFIEIVRGLFLVLLLTSS